jgi:hypothetical protein
MQHVTWRLMPTLNGTTTSALWAWVTTTFSTTTPPTRQIVKNTFFLFILQPVGIEAVLI